MVNQSQWDEINEYNIPSTSVPIDRVNIPRADVVKCMGDQLDNRLTWKQIDLIVKDIKWILGKRSILPCA